LNRSRTWLRPWWRFVPLDSSSHEIGITRRSRNPWFLFHFFAHRTLLEIRDQSGRICTILRVIYVWSCHIAGPMKTLKSVFYDTSIM
jgi:hypothetical protein